MQKHLNLPRLGSDTTTEINFEVKRVPSHWYKEVKMKKAKTSKSLRLIAFFLVAIILICTFGFTADGWHFKKQGNNSLPQDGSPDAPTETGDPEALPDDSTDQMEENLPKYYNRLTGEETTEALSNARHTSFVISPSAPMYGISHSDLLIEFPSEDGTTRLLSFINAPSTIAKLGSLSKTRGYISNLSKAFDSPIFAYGNDDSIDYQKCPTADQFTDEDILEDFVYTEFARYTYTSADLIEKAFSSTDISVTDSALLLPFIFSPDDTPIKGETYFNKISIPYSASSSTTLSYAADLYAYLFEKNGEQITDLSNGNKVYFKNCFVLFADSTTYETSDSTQMVLETIGEGAGYYFTEGTAKQIKWSLSLEGKMKFYDEKSNELIINAGTSYISFVKSSKIDDIVLS